MMMNKNIFPEKTIRYGKVFKSRGYAKINLFLQIKNCIKYERKGYHELLTIFQPVDLYDEIEIIVEKKSKKTSLQNKKLLFHCVHGKDIFFDIDYKGEINEKNPFADKDLCYKAGVVFFEELEKILYCKKTTCENVLQKDYEDPLPIRVQISVQKNIPVRAGMAGGSIDAAKTLVLLNCVYNHIFTVEQLEKMSSHIGADVPFGVENKLSLGTKFGNVIEKINIDDNAKKRFPYENTHYYIIVILKDGLSTPEVFNEFDKIEQTISQHTIHSEKQSAECVNKIIKNYFNLQELSKYIHNDLQVASIKIFPYLDTILQEGEKAGALKSFISGSGPTCVMLASNYVEAEKIKNFLEKNMQIEKYISRIFITKNKI